MTGRSSRPGRTVFPSSPSCPSCPSCHEDPVRGHHRPLSVRRRDLVFADVPARPAGARTRRVLHRRHRRMRVRPRAEHARDGPLLRDFLHSQRTRAVRPRRSLGVRQLRRHISRPGRGRGAEVLRRRRPLHQPLRRIVVLARRIRAHPAEGLHRFRPGVHATRHREGRAVVRRVLPALRSSLHVRLEHRHHPAATSRRASSPGARRGSP